MTLYSSCCAPKNKRKVQNSGFGFVWEIWVMRELLDKLKLREFCWASWSPFYLKINIQNLSSWRRSRKLNQSPIFNPCSSWISQILHMHSIQFFFVSSLCKNLIWLQPLKVWDINFFLLFFIAFDSGFPSLLGYFW